jgi:hypothetical protein
MSRFLHIRVLIALIGAVVWGYGVSQDDATVRLVGISVLALSLVLRFVPKRFQRDKGEGI